MSELNNTLNISLLRRAFARVNIQLPPRPVAPPSHEPETKTLLELAGLIGLAVMFHFFIADTLIAVFALFIYALKLILVLTKRKTSTPPQAVIMLLTILSIGLIILLYGGWNGQRAGISFLVLLVSLKFLESRVLRDYYVVCLILYFLAASSFLFDSSMTNIAIVILYTIAITSIMLKLSSPISSHWKTTLISAIAIVCKALPLALILFFFFPRVHGSFGFIPSQDRNQNASELNNSLVAGDLATSAFNNELAFRVEFEESIPNNNLLYWRSKVMPSEENFSWSVRVPSPQQIGIAQDKQVALTALTQQTDIQDKLIRYSILHESSTDLFLPYLDYVTEYSQGRLLHDLSVWQRRPQSRTFSYEGSSLLQLSIVEGSQINTQNLLRTSSQPTARTQALLAKWKQQTSDPMQLAQQVLTHFTAEEFYYSLYPRSLDELQPLDDFLFDSKTGYCEHYASAFTLIMRWLGVPARVVAGYQGGRPNQSGQFLEVRYSDAHAWSEILVNGEWIRVDPTAAISPERIEFGMDAFMSQWTDAGLGELDNTRGLTNYLNPTGVNRFYRQLRDNWNNIGYQWNKWVVNYDADTQRELLTKLGIEGRNRYGFLVMIMFGSIAIVLLFYFWRLLPQSIKRDEAQLHFLRFVERFKHNGIIKNLSDTPNDFASKAINAFPDQQSQISEIVAAYNQLRYGKTPYELNKFKQLVKQFRLIPNK